PLNAGPVEFTGKLVLAAVTAGVLTAMAAALVPAIRASLDEPADAVRRAPRAAGWIFYGLLLGSSILLLTAGLSFMAGREHLPTPVGAYGGVLLVLIFTLLTAPPLSPLVARLLTPLLPPPFRPAGPRSPAPPHPIPRRT